MYRVVAVGATILFTVQSLSAAARECSDPTQPADRRLGREVALTERLHDGDELVLPLQAVLEHGQRLFDANWTVQEGGGRPQTTGTGQPLADPGDPLVFPRNFNRISAPDANSCKGCHDLPSSGGGGDHVTNAFVLGKRCAGLTCPRAA